ncbi:hypothetical protein B0A48_08972 [Cryoendolithus antarcticus]|uniref:Uncharacterized protein n=1 Tax=Cryoendolithus antarcticus TaxID=1507870 RepID=A0A1V8T5D4_9PEZI|nr:hypothetical protein B0A48_08972 [Cryoendolithus antarcticus]
MPQEPGSIGVGNADASGKAGVHVGSAYHQGYGIDEKQSHGPVNAVYHVSYQGVHHHYAASGAVTPAAPSSPFEAPAPAPRRECSAPPAQPSKDASTTAENPDRAAVPSSDMSTVRLKSLDEAFADHAKSRDAGFRPVPTPVPRCKDIAAPTPNALGSSTEPKSVLSLDAIIERATLTGCNDTK